MNDEARAREVLAAEYERSGDVHSAMLVRSAEPDFLEDMIIRAMLAFNAPPDGEREDRPAFFTLYNALHRKIAKARDDDRSSVSISVKQLGEILDWAGTYKRMAHPSAQERETMAIIKRGADLIKPGAGETVFYLRVGGERTHLSTHAATGVDPQEMIGLAIAALRAEAKDAANCPAHKASTHQGNREAIARLLSDIDVRASNAEALWKEYGSPGPDKCDRVPGSTQYGAMMAFRRLAKDIRLSLLQAPPPTDEALRAEGYAEAVQWLRNLDLSEKPATQGHSAGWLADQMEGALTPSEKGEKL